MEKIYRLEIEDRGFADFNFRWVECQNAEEIELAKRKEFCYSFGGKFYGWSTNPIRDAICAYLYENKRSFDFKNRLPKLIDFLNGNDNIYFNCLPIDTRKHNQVFEGVHRNNFIENFEDYQQRFESLYKSRLEWDDDYYKFFHDMASSKTPLERIIKAFKIQIKLNKKKQFYGF